MAEMARVLCHCCWEGFSALGTGVGNELWHKAGENLALNSPSPRARGEVLKEEQETDGR